MRSIKKLLCHQSLLFKNKIIIILKEKLKEVKLLGKPKVLLKNSFNSFKQLEDIFFPLSLEIIESESIVDCPKLQRLMIPNNVKEIQINAILNCQQLKTFNSPQHLLENLPKDQIVELEITSSTLKELKQNDIKGLDKLQSLTLPENIEKIPEEIFKECS